ncbi:MAG TPA: SIMPL domain-containing protein [Xanthobacteraceae bacterium]|nr:SIMPL domain-containing protein [Xanthobacteraceae bacterium]
MNRKISLLAALFLGFFAHAASAQTPAAQTRVPTLNLTGEGSAEASPELAVVQIGVAVTGKVAKDALAENSRLLAAALNAAKEQGIEARDLQTSGLSLRPDIVRAEKWPHREVIGYQVNNVVTMRVRDISKLGALLDRLVVLGINDIRNINFSVTNPAPLIEQARTAAIKDAISKAEKYAEAANLRIVRVLTINESGVEVPAVRPMVLTRAASAPRPEVPIEAGEIVYRARVNVEFEIAPK